MSGLNYKRFEHLDVSDEDSSSSDADAPSPQSSFVPPGFGQPRPPSLKPAFVKLHPEDDGAGLPEAIFKDPRTFKPHRSPDDSRSEYWGLAPYETMPKFPGSYYFGHDGMQHMMRQMEAQFKYFNGDLKPPEEQFVQVLMGSRASLIQARLSVRRQEREGAFELQHRQTQGLRLHRQDLAAIPAHFRERSTAFDSPHLSLFGRAVFVRLSRSSSNAWHWLRSQLPCLVIF
jgi:hypothetical protein